MLMTYFMAGIAFAVPELIIVYNCKWLKKFIESNPIWELGFSLALSWALAAIMGLGVGVTVAIANVFSTGITLAFYHLDVINRYKRATTTYKTTKVKLQSTLDDIHIIFHALAAPFKLLKLVLHWIALGISWISHPTIGRAKRAHIV